jgi:DNA-binding transcriptional ArsR family regulator
MTATKSSSEEAVIKALASRGELTVTEIAATTGLGRSTVAKRLAGLERAGLARRSTGGRQGGRRLPDRWSVGASDERSVAGSSRQRLRPGQLDGLVFDFVTAHGKDAALGATPVAKGLGRSAGAVGNCLVRLAAAGQVRQVSQYPRRYSPAAPRSRKRHGTRRARKGERS